MWPGELRRQIRRLMALLPARLVSAQARPGQAGKINKLLIFLNIFFFPPIETHQPADPERLAGGQLYFQHIQGANI